jgi:pimeloyl-ACP methyl ester carboxylesterase
MLGPAPYIQTPMESAAMILAALDELGIDKFSIAGNSLGGCIAIALATLWPGSVRRLALVSVSLAARQSRTDIAKGDEAAKQFYNAKGEPLPRDPSEVAAFGTLDPRVSDEQNLSRAKAGTWIRPSERGVARMGVPDYLPRIAAPTLLVYGDRGTYIRYEAVGRKLIPNVTVEKIPEAGSFVHQEKPAETARLLQEFLDA